MKTREPGAMCIEGCSLEYRGAESQMWEITTSLLPALLRTAQEAQLCSLLCDTSGGQRSEYIQREQLRQWKA